MEKYNVELDMNNENSLSIMIGMIEKRSEILEVGCANGRMTKYMSEDLECIVDIIEIDGDAGNHAKQYSRISSIGVEEGDIEKTFWEKNLQGNQYDYIIFADVLEHLRDPKKVMIRIKRFLKDSGSVILSVPNLAHNAVILNLINNDFEYRELGLLDNTHIHFFTYNSLVNMIRNSGYIHEVETATYCGAEATELGADYRNIPLDLRKFIRNRKFGNVYQYIFKIAKAKKNSGQIFCIDKNFDMISSYLFKCYYLLDGMSTYSEDYCKMFYFIPGVNHFIVEIKGKRDITGIRIDPMECNCIISNFHIYNLLNNKKEIIVKESNAIQSEIGYIFDTEDPNVEIEVPENRGKVILDINFQIERFEGKDISIIAKTIIGERKLLYELNTEIENEKERYRKDLERIQSIYKSTEEDKQRIELQARDYKNQQDKILEEYKRNYQMIVTQKEEMEKKVIEEQQNLLEWQAWYREQIKERENEKEILIKGYEKEKIMLEKEYEKMLFEYAENLKFITDKNNLFIKESECWKEEKNQILEKYQNLEKEYLRGQELCDRLSKNEHNYIGMVSMYESILNSTTWKLTKPLRFCVDKLKLFGKKSLIFRGAKCIREHGVKYTWKRFCNRRKARKLSLYTVQNTCSEEELKRQREQVFIKSIKFSIVVPVYNTPIVFLEDMVQSVINQTYGNWELCLADGSDEAHKNVGEKINDLLKCEKRIKYIKLTENKGISENTNVCIEMATGKYIALFDHDDILHPSALYEVMKAICNEGADFIYTDENTFCNNIEDAYFPHFKPDFSPDTLRSYNYICHLTVFKKSLLKKAGGGLRKEFDGSQDYDLILRLTEVAQKIVHIPKILYYWRAHEQSVALDISAKPYTLEAAKKAIEEHLVRMKLDGKVCDSKIPSTYRICYEIKGKPLISIIIPNKDHIEELDKCIKSVEKKSTYRYFEIIIIENNSVEQSTFKYYKRIQQKYKNIKVVTWKGEFNYSKINNFGFKYARGEQIVLLNNDVEILTPDWIEQMLMYTQRSDVGAAGMMLYYPDDTIQHAGVILGLGGIAGHSHKYFKRGEYGYVSRLTICQNLSAVTAACLMVRSDVYRQVGGLDEGFAVAFNDVDFCVKIRKAGYLIVWTPYAEAYHYESKSRGLEDTPEKKNRFQGEIQRFKFKWSDVLEKGDPYYNPNLTLDSEDFSLCLKL